eukprot:TRINITY_DN2209_c0_g1_i7.p1 TRINITY_DN2209_c0_g1~~TRINITY_DN2209_c0_g1_i7.p1  ORF type:complete len:178 (-),score=0.28 TRINITY_DN2209_c0_g1_i7:25-558(-)
MKKYTTQQRKDLHLFEDGARECVKEINRSRIVHAATLLMLVIGVVLGIMAYVEDDSGSYISNIFSSIPLLLTLFGFYWFIQKGGIANITQTSDFFVEHCNITLKLFNLRLEYDNHSKRLNLVELVPLVTSPKHVSYYYQNEEAHILRADDPLSVPHHHNHHHGHGHNNHHHHNNRLH